MSCLDAESTTTYPAEQSSKTKIVSALENKGYHILQGGKFGCDYLLYENDPSSCHATYLVSVLNSKSADVPAIDVISNARLAGNVNKTFMFCYWDDECGDVGCTEVQWTGW
jgi:tRNA-intron lyase